MKLFCCRGIEEVKNIVSLEGLKSIVNTSTHWRNCAPAFVLAHVRSVIREMVPSMLQHTTWVSSIHNKLFGSYEKREKAKVM